MAAYIGSVTFEYPLAWVDKGRPRVLGSNTVTRSGNVVMLRGENTSQAYIDAKLKFSWVPRADVVTLISYWESGNQFSANLEDSGSDVTIQFVPQNGVDMDTVRHVKFGDRAVHARIEGTQTDYYMGEMNVIIVGS